MEILQRARRKRRRWEGRGGGRGRGRCAEGGSLLRGHDTRGGAHGGENALWEVGGPTPPPPPPPWLPRRGGLVKRLGVTRGGSRVGREQQPGLGEPPPGTPWGAGIPPTPGAARGVLGGEQGWGASRWQPGWGRGDLTPPRGAPHE